MNTPSEDDVGAGQVGDEPESLVATLEAPPFFFGRRRAREFARVRTLEDLAAWREYFERPGQNQAVAMQAFQRGGPPPKSPGDRPTVPETYSPPPRAPVSRQAFLEREGATSLKDLLKRASPRDDEARRSQTGGTGA